LKTIRTVVADIKPNELGWCQCHEHIFLKEGPSKKINDALCMDDYEKSKLEVFSYKEAGGNSFVDCQPGYFGRMAKSLINVSKETGVNIISTTGFHKLEFCEDLEQLKRVSVQRLIYYFTGEINVGMVEGCKRLDGKAGLLKCAMICGDDWNCGVYAKLFDAVAYSATETNAPIIVHLDSDADVLSLIRYFEKHGVKAQKLILCHLDRAKYDFSYHKEVASTGAYLEYDTINRLKYHSNEKEIELISHMIDAGYENQLLLGMDTTNQRLKAYGADFGMDFILADFADQMLKSGISKQALNKIMKTNAAKALEY